MKKSITVQVAKIMVEINSRLSGLSEGQYLLGIKSGRKCVNLRRLEYKNGLNTGPASYHKKRFANYEELLPYLVAFNDGLEFAGLEIYQPDLSNTPDFLHPDLSSDWRQGQFNHDNFSYEIVKYHGSDSPESFELNILPGIAGETSFQYSYDNKTEAEKDEKLFIESLIKRAGEFKPDIQQVLSKYAAQ